MDECRVADFLSFFVCVCFNSTILSLRYPAGHARNTTHDLEDILDHKFDMLSKIAFSAKDKDACLAKLTNLQEKSAHDIKTIYDFDIDYKDDFKDA